MRTFDYVGDIDRPIPKTAKQIQKAQNKNSEIIEELKATSAKIRRLNYPSRRDADKIDNIVASLQKELLYPTNGEIILGRNKGDIEFRTCVLFFAKIVHKLFGSYLVGSVANLAMTAFPHHDTKNVGKVIENLSVGAPNSNELRL